MPFFRSLSVRAKEAELMDDFSMGGEELREALKHLRRLNRIFAAPGPTLVGVEKLWRNIRCPNKLTIVDVGAGSGDVNRKLLQWAEKNGIEMELTLVDLTEEACSEARQWFAKDSRVRVIRGDARELPSASADIVTASQFLHHFDGMQLVEIVSHMLRTSRYGAVINDIHRHVVSYTAVWLTARLISRNRYILNDAPLSVAKGFKRKDWETLMERLQNDEMTYQWRPMFRYSVVIPKPDSFKNREVGRGEA
ncbi:methyltransferase domain-containing protein [Pullulanibacillus sp. KACC 23026]|uniref:methyltransferase domain-containing protein n=1 Tax=Pullulanibacillus sp. KACC 23026 TaxID=3028315 RepID=UPI0023AF4F34|nr:methyltransferase domain-containing protein [Pullulanibacillus sp. KACC 23026]WEG14849.1 methyltransferase domain-containing protein [Pullulanibacillus sp. KACC 23026]